MKTLSTLLLAFSLVWIHASAQEPMLSAEDWRSDLAFLKETVHKEYPFLFKKITAVQFDSAVNQLHQDIPRLQPHEIVAGLARIVASFQYGHTDIRWTGGVVKFHIIPVSLYWFNSGIHVEGIHKDYSQALGAKLLKVNGVPVEEALKAVRLLLPVENEQYFKAYVLDFLCIPEALHAQKVTQTLQNAITFTLEKDGKTFDQTFPAMESFRFPRKYSLIQPNADWVSSRDQSKTPLYLKNLDKIYYYEYLPETKTVYVRQSQIQDDPSDPIPAFYKRVFDFIEKNEVDRLVLDVRLNGGGNNYKNKTIVKEVIKSKINQPGKFFVIIGRRTFSACQNLVNELDNYTEAVFVGEPTSENINFYGDNRQVVLPKSKIPIFLSFAWWQDKPQWEDGPWLAPHVAVDMSYEQYRTNQDPVLDAVFSFTGSNFVRDPIGHLEQLFNESKLDQVKSEAARMVKDSAYKFIDFEKELNSRGYELLIRNQFQPALFVLQMNSELFPQSANAWDSLGEAYWKSEQKDKAIECYNNAIRLDPNGPTGDNARNMLKEINKQ
ncbi:MAG: hypothetical protein KIPDCIKN_01357 [Haliscomenobacter sp.]|nr:hypothetical protein [Haliscomenobacter sp.]